MTSPRTVPSWLGIAAVTLLGAALRLYGLGTPALWYDEALSLHYARMPIVDLVSHLGRTEVNTPFYYLLLKAWTILGDSEFLLRLPSALAGILCILVVHALGRLVGGPRVGLLAALFLATSSVHIRFSQEVRPYALMALAAGVALWGLTRLLQGSGGVAAWFAYVAGTSIALHLHNTMVLLPFLANLAALVWWLGPGRPDRRFPLRWVAANALALVLWSPVVALTVRQAMTVLQNTWMAPTDVLHVTGTVTDTYAPAMDGWWVTLLFAGVALHGVWQWRRRPVALLATVTFAVGVPVLSFVISYWRPILLGRTILWPTLPFYVLLAAGCLGLRPRVLTTGAVLVLLGSQAVSVAGHLREQRLEPWDEIARQVSDGLEAGDVILIHPWKARIPFDFYFRPGTLPHTIFGVRLDLPHGRKSESGILTLDELPALARDHPRIWLVMRNRAFGGDVVREKLGGVATEADAWSARQLEVVRFAARAPTPSPE